MFDHIAIQQKTALFRALRMKYDAHKCRIHRGRIFIDGMELGHIDDVWTVDHGGHSTRVYIRHIHIATVFGSIST